MCAPTRLDVPAAESPGSTARRCGRGESTWCSQARSAWVQPHGSVLLHSQGGARHRRCSRYSKGTRGPAPPAHDGPPSRWPGPHASPLCFPHPPRPGRPGGVDNHREESSHTGWPAPSWTPRTHKANTHVGCMSYPCGTISARRDTHNVPVCLTPGPTLTPRLRGLGSTQRGT